MIVVRRRTVAVVVPFRGYRTAFAAVAPADHADEVALQSVQAITFNGRRRRFAFAAVAPSAVKTDKVAVQPVQATPFLARHRHRTAAVQPIRSVATELGRCASVIAARVCKTNVVTRGRLLALRPHRSHVRYRPSRYG